MKKITLEEKIIDYFKGNSESRSQSLWIIANALYDNCMSKSQPGNGIKVANIRMAAYKSDKLEYYVNSNEEGCIFLKKENINMAIPWLKTFYENALNADKAKDIYPVVSGIKDLFASKEYGKVNDILLSMELDKLSYTAMVTFVATSFPARHKLSSWTSSVEKIKNILINDGLDYQKILKGLI